MGQTQDRLNEALAIRDHTVSAHSFNANEFKVVLRHLSGSRTGSIQVLDRQSILLGRGNINDVAFDLFQDAVVSSHHAEIREESGRYVLYDMGSLNGTHLNGHLVGRAAIEEGDLIGLGRSGPRLRFELQRRPAAEAVHAAASDERVRSFVANAPEAPPRANQVESFPIQKLDGPTSSPERNLLLVLAALIGLNIALQIIHLLRR
ncbi:MAG: FHA domain-containing protein [Planctomycetes bacterium]|nr:FHA domain-containing protein [Planctomycetota bacterium]